MSSIDSKKKFRKIPSLTLQKSKKLPKTQKNVKIIKKPERIRLFSIHDNSKTGSRSSSTSSIDSNEKKSTLVLIFTPKIAKNHPNHPKNPVKPERIRFVSIHDDSKTDSRSSSTSSIDSNEKKISLSPHLHP
jgi:hypothetical protein